MWWAVVIFMLMKQTNNKEDFFSQLKDVFYKGDMLHPVSCVAAYIDWVVNEFYTGEEDVSEKEIEEWIWKSFNVFMFEGVECIRTFKNYITPDNCESSKGQIGIFVPSCSFEISVMLKKLGYNEFCDTSYQKSLSGKVYAIRDITDYPAFGSELNYPAPDLLSVMEWLRLKHDTIIELKYTDENVFIYIISNTGDKMMRKIYSDSNEINSTYDNPYHCMNAGITKALSIILKDKQP